MPSSSIRFLAGIGLVLLAASCRNAPNAAGHAALARLPELHFTPTASIGGSSAEGPDALGSVLGGTLIPETDLLAVIDGTTQEISYFTRTGAYVRTVGGRGGGPGESQALRKVWGRSDGGLCSWDIQQTRVTEFNASGEVVHIGRTDTEPLQGLLPGFVAFLDDCAYVVRDSRSGMGMHDEPEGIRRDTVRFLLYAANGSLRDTITTVQAARKWFRNRNGVWGAETPVFGNELESFVKGNDLWVGITDSLRWIRFNLLSSAVDTVRLPTSVRHISKAEVEAERQRRLNAVKPSPRLRGVIMDGRSAADVFSEAESQAIRAVPSNSTAPAYDRVVSGSDGSIWLREFPMPTENNARWVLIAGGSSVVGQLKLTRADTVLAADRNCLLVLARDSMDAPVVRVLQRTQN